MSGTGLDSPWACYERLIPLKGEILSAAAQRVPLASLATQARALGLWDGKRVTPGSEAQLAMVLDLGVLGPIGDHGRGIDRQAKAAPPPEGSDSAALLAALQAARFGIFRIGPAHGHGGLDLEELSGEGTVYLMDQSLAKVGRVGAVIGARLAQPAEFHVTCGVVIPVSAALLLNLLAGKEPTRARVRPAPEPAPDDPAMLALLEEPAAMARLKTLPKDPLFAAKTYRAALDLGLVGPVPGRTPTP